LKSSDTLVPHVAIPFRFISGRDGIDVNEQDSLDDVYDCVQAIVRYTVRFRPELPTFGIDDQTFRETEIDLQLIQDQVVLWETRADVLYSQAPDAVDSLIDVVKLRVARQSGGSQRG
jgi:hypothetical protein